MLKNIKIPLTRNYHSGTISPPIKLYLDILPEIKKMDLELGFFSSSAFQVLSYGLAQFIQNGGCMRIITNSHLSDEDSQLITSEIQDKLVNEEIQSYSKDKSKLKKLQMIMSKREQHFYNCLLYLKYKKVNSINKRSRVKVVHKEISESKITNSHVSPVKMKIGKFVKTTMLDLISNDLIDESEIRNLQNAEYSKITFDIQYPLLRKKRVTDPDNILRYWKGAVTINGQEFFMCSEWYEQPLNNDRPFFMKWLKKIKGNEII